MRVVWVGLILVDFIVFDLVFGRFLFRECWGAFADFELLLACIGICFITFLWGISYVFCFVW